MSRCGGTKWQLRNWLRYTQITLAQANAGKNAYVLLFAAMTTCFEIVARFTVVVILQ